MGAIQCLLRKGTSVELWVVFCLLGVFLCFVLLTQARVKIGDENLLRCTEVCQIQQLLNPFTLPNVFEPRKLCKIKLKRNMKGNMSPSMARWLGDSGEWAGGKLCWAAPLSLCCWNKDTIWGVRTSFLLDLVWCFLLSHSGLLSLPPKPSGPWKFPTLAKLRATLFQVRELTNFNQNRTSGKIKVSSKQRFHKGISSLPLLQKR